MPDNSPENYVKWITPQPGDSTYSILKAHLLFEELLNAYLARVLPHSSALQGARLTFAQTLALARASSPHLLPDHWIWAAINHLNKIRNSLSHEARPKDLPEKSKAYVDLVLVNSKAPLPDSGFEAAKNPRAPNETLGHAYSAMDMVTINLYYTTAALLGFKLSAAPDG
jgi:hypothetical protein